MQNFVEAGPGKSRFADAVGEVNVEFAIGDVEFLGREFLFAEIFAGFIARIGSEKRDEKFIGLDVGTFGKGIFRDDTTKFCRGAKNHFGAAGEFLFDGLLDAFCDESEIAFICFENDIPALHVGLRVFEFERGIKRPQRLHFDLAAAADVDGAKHGDEHWHERSLTGDP